jgi:anaerobic selenocysteine-containing dehydrogenase
LMIISDSMNRRGGVWFHPGFVNRLDAAPLPLISEILGPGPKSRPELNSIIGEYPCAALADEINAGNIRALINLGGSLIRSFPDANTLQPALQKLEALVTLEIVANETTDLSTHVLPCKDQLERPDLSMWDFLSGRLDAWYVPAIVKPVGERRASWWIVAELMRELGLARPAMLPADADAEGAEDSILAALMVNARCSFAELKQRRHIELPLEFPARWVDAHIERFGGWRLAPAALLEQLAAQSRAHLDAVGKPLPLSLIPRRQRRHRRDSSRRPGRRADESRRCRRCRRQRRTAGDGAQRAW